MGFNSGTCVRARNPGPFCFLALTCSALPCSVPQAVDTMSYGAPHGAQNQSQVGAAWPFSSAPQAEGVLGGDHLSAAQGLQALQGCNAAAAAQHALAQALQAQQNMTFPFRNQPSSAPASAYAPTSSQHLACAAMLNQLQAAPGAQGGGGVSHAGNGFQDQMLMQMQLLAGCAGNLGAVPPSALAMLLAAGASAGQWSGQQQSQQPGSTSTGQLQSSWPGQHFLQNAIAALQEEPSGPRHPTQPHTAVESGIVQPSPDLSGGSEDNTTHSGQESPLDDASPRDLGQAHDGSAAQSDYYCNDRKRKHASTADRPQQHWSQGAGMPSAPPPPPHFSPSSHTGAATANTNDTPPLSAPGTSMPPPPPRSHAHDISCSTPATPHSYVRGVLGPQRWAVVRTTLLKQQQTFVQQLFELHKLRQM